MSLTPERRAELQQRYAPREQGDTAADRRRQRRAAKAQRDAAGLEHKRRPTQRQLSAIAAMSQQLGERYEHPQTRARASATIATLRQRLGIAPDQRVGTVLAAPTPDPRPATDAQRAYIAQLQRHAGLRSPIGALTRDDAQRRIAALK